MTMRRIEDVTRHWVCRLPNGKYVGNNISGPNTRTFVEVEREWACQYVSAEAARAMASEHGAKDFDVLEA